MSAHTKTLLGRVASAMSAVRPLFWIPVLRKLTKSVIRNCYGCKRFRAMHYPNPKPGLIPRDKTEHVRSLVRTMQAHFIISLKVKKILKHISYNFPVVLAELCILSSCQILLLPSLSKVLRN